MAKTFAIVRVWAVTLGRGVNKTPKIRIQCGRAFLPLSPRVPPREMVTIPEGTQQAQLRARAAPPFLAGFFAGEKQKYLLAPGLFHMERLPRVRNKPRFPCNHSPLWRTVTWDQNKAISKANAASCFFFFFYFFWGGCGEGGRREGFKKTNKKSESVSSHNCS